MIRRIVIAAAVVGALGIWPSLAAAAIPSPFPIGPDQTFMGSVNGASANAVIKMGCFGPIRPGQLGHPLTGQSTEVSLSKTAAAGFTGNANQIEAVLMSPTPSAGIPIVLGTFTTYDTPAPISTSLLLPCGGTSEVVFLPVNGGPLAQPWDDTVSFEGQP